MCLLLTTLFAVKIKGAIVNGCALALSLLATRCHCPLIVLGDSIVEMPACKGCLFILCCIDAWVCETYRYVFLGSEFLKDVGLQIMLHC